MQKLFGVQPAVAVETIRTMRRNVMTSKPEQDMDLTEKWIRRFAEQNTAYSMSWADTFGEIEDAMAKFQIASVGHRAEAIADYRRWIEEKAALDPVDNIPFRQEAELFSPFYWANKAKYAEAMA